MLSLSCLTATAYGQFWPSSYERSAVALRSGEVEQRREAARELARMPASVAKQLLPQALADPDPEVRLAAGAVVVEEQFEQAAPIAIQWLSDSDPRVRAMAARMLAQLGPNEQAIAPLARVLSDPSADARTNAARALARARSAEAARVLLNHLDDSNEEFQLEVIDALAALGEEAAVLPLIAKVQDARASVRRAAIRALSGLDGAESGTRALVLALADSDPEVRIAAIRALGDLKADAVDALEEILLRDREIPVRVAALDALVRLSTPRALRLAVQMLAHSRQELRSEALSKLSEVGVRAQAELTQCLEGEGASDGLAGCALALGRGQSPTAAGTITRAYREGRLPAAAALPALAATEDPAALPVALEMLSSSSEPVRLATLDALWRLLDPLRPDGRAVEPLAEALHRARSPEEAALLLPLLGRTGSARAVSHLLPYLDAEAPLALRIAATRATGWIKRAAVDPKVMIAGLTAAEAELRWETAMAVRDGEWHGVARSLVALLERGGAGEQYGLATALWGPAATIRQPALSRRVQALVETAAEREHDVLLEAFARIPWELTKAAITKWTEDSLPEDAKLAEVLVQRPQAASLLIAMLDRERIDVLANAVWSLGEQQATGALPRLRELVQHADVTVAANAVAALARVTGATDTATSGNLLCSLLREKRPPVLSNALAGLRLLRMRCGDGQRERRLLETHASPFVRERAAALVTGVPSREAREDEQALRRCARRDVDGRVAAHCIGQPSSENTSGSQPSSVPAAGMTILVIPAATAAPKPGIPFALQLGDGFTRFGWADRRGAVYQLGSPGDPRVRLLLPAGLW